MASKTFRHEGRWHVAYHGDCSEPIRIAVNDTERTFAYYWTRCRRCGACRRARTNYWGYAGMEQTRQTEEAGLRTWFGTLTLTPDYQSELLDRARSAHHSPNAEWWDDASCDERFRLVRAEYLAELQKFWKRLRKAGHRFKYLAVFERHKSGLPHVHFLLHEMEAPIRKRDIQAQWGLGYSNVSIVGGRSRKAAAPERAAWYVVKYLSKSEQARQLASRGYKPLKRPSSIVNDEMKREKKGPIASRKGNAVLRKQCDCPSSEEDGKEKETQRKTNPRKIGEDNPDPNFSKFYPDCSEEVT